MNAMQKKRYEQALEYVKNERFRKAAEVFDSEGSQDRMEIELQAELEQLAEMKHMISNYSDRIMDDIAETLHEEFSMNSNEEVEG